MKENIFFLNPPFFLFPWQLRQNLFYRFRLFFSLSRSTRCGCCSYQVSSISVRRVTCYDNFCVFQLFSILAVSMATTAILKKKQLLKAQLHMAYAIPTRFHKVWSRHLREIERTKMCGRIIVKKKVRTKLSQLAGHYWQKYLSWRDIIGRSVIALNYLSWRDIIRRSIIRLVVSISEMFIRYTCIYVWNSQFQNNVIYHN